MNDLTPANMASRLLLTAVFELLEAPEENENTVTTNGIKYAVTSAWNDKKGVMEAFIWEDRAGELLGLMVFWRFDGDNEDTLRVCRYGDDDHKVSPKAEEMLRSMCARLGIGINEPGEIITKAA